MRQIGHFVHCWRHLVSWGVLGFGVIFAQGRAGSSFPGYSESCRRRGVRCLRGVDARARNVHAIVKYRVEGLGFLVVLHGVQEVSFSGHQKYHLTVTRDSAATTQTPKLSPILTPCPAI